MGISITVTRHLPARPHSLIIRRLRAASTTLFSRGFRRHDLYAFGTTLLSGGLTWMTPSTQYREFAEECLRLAEQAEHEHHRNTLKEMAEAWSQLAEEEDEI